MRGFVQCGIAHCENSTAVFVVRAATGDAVAFAVPRLNSIGCDFGAFLTEFDFRQGETFFDPRLGRCNEIGGRHNGVDDARLQCFLRIERCALQDERQCGHGTDEAR